MSQSVAPATKETEGGTGSVCGLRCLAPAGSVPDDARDAYLIDGLTLDAARLATAAGIVLPREGVARATELLAAGARRVLLGEAALVDASIVAALAATFGGERVGVYVPARRFEVSWSFDTRSNADFRVLTPSLGAPAWEVLRADGTQTGTQAFWWIGEMLKLGASEVLLCVDIRDDTDLNLCADGVERLGDRFWIGPLADPAPALDEWRRYGHARQLALPPLLYARAIAAEAGAQAIAAEAGDPEFATEDAMPVERAA
jgi:hypothetical protein